MTFTNFNQQLISGLRGAPVANTTELAQLSARDYELRYVADKTKEYLFRLGNTPAAETIRDSANTGYWYPQSTPLSKKIVDAITDLDGQQTAVHELIIQEYSTGEAREVPRLFLTGNDQDPTSYKVTNADNSDIWVKPINDAYYQLDLDADNAGGTLAFNVNLAANNTQALDYDLPSDYRVTRVRRKAGSQDIPISIYGSGGNLVYTIPVGNYDWHDFGRSSINDVYFLGKPFTSDIALLDEDDLASDSDTQAATQQSIKAYVDNKSGKYLGSRSASIVAQLNAPIVGTTTGAEYLAASTENIITGRNISTGGKLSFWQGLIPTLTSIEVVDVKSDPEITITDDTVDVPVGLFHFRLDGTILKMNRLVAEPNLVVLLDEDDMVSDDDTKAATQQSVKAYVDSQKGRRLDTRATKLQIAAIEAPLNNAVTRLEGSFDEWVFHKNDNGGGIVADDGSGSWYEVPHTFTESEVLLGQIFWDTNNIPAKGKLYAGERYNWSDNPSLKRLFDLRGHEFIIDNGNGTFNIADHSDFIRAGKADIGKHFDDTTAANGLAANTSLTYKGNQPTLSDNSGSEALNGNGTLGVKTNATSGFSSAISASTSLSGDTETAPNYRKAYFGIYGDLTTIVTDTEDLLKVLQETPGRFSVQSHTTVDIPNTGVNGSTIAVGQLVQTPGTERTLIGFKFVEASLQHIECTKAGRYRVRAGLSIDCSSSSGLIGGILYARLNGVWTQVHTVTKNALERDGVGDRSAVAVVLYAEVQLGVGDRLAVNYYNRTNLGTNSKDFYFYAEEIVPTLRVVNNNQVPVTELAHKSSQLAGSFALNGSTVAEQNIDGLRIEGTDIPRTGKYLVSSSLFFSDVDDKSVGFVLRALDGRELLRMGASNVNRENNNNGIQPVSFAKVIELQAGVGLQMYAKHETADGDGQGVGSGSFLEIYELPKFNVAGSGASATQTIELIDEDDMVSDDDTKAPTQQSVKAYVDAAASTPVTLAADSHPDLELNGQELKLNKPIRTNHTITSDWTLVRDEDYFFSSTSGGTRTLSLNTGFVSSSIIDTTYATETLRLQSNATNVYDGVSRVAAATVDLAPGLVYSLMGNGSGWQVVPIYNPNIPNQATIDQLTTDYQAADTAQQTAIDANTAKRHDAVTLASDSDSALTLSGQELKLTLPPAQAGIELIDEDDMASNSATKAPSQQSVKAYVDNQPKGILPWVSTKTYATNDLVSHNNTIWVATQASTNVIPSSDDGRNWLAVEKNYSDTYSIAQDQFASNQGDWANFANVYPLQGNELLKMDDAGTFDFNQDGDPITVAAGDILQYQVDTWVKLDNTPTQTLASTDDLTEGTTNLYYTDARVSANTNVAANTAKVSADGSVTTHSDITSAGSGNIITSVERGNLNSNTTARHAAVTLSATSDAALTLNGQELTLTLPAQTNAVDSVNGATGTVVLDTGDIAEDGNLYYTEARVTANTNVAANTAARHDAVTLGSNNDSALTLTGQELELTLPEQGVKLWTSGVTHDVGDVVRIDGETGLWQKVSQPIMLPGSNGSEDPRLDQTNAWVKFRTGNYIQTVNSITTNQDGGSITLGTGNIPETGSNLYYTETRVAANATVTLNTQARHAAVTLASDSDAALTLNGQELKLTLPASNNPTQPATCATRAIASDITLDKDDPQYQNINSIGTNVTVNLPADAINGTKFYIKNRSATRTFIANGKIIGTNQVYFVIYDGSAWVEF